MRRAETKTLRAAIGLAAAAVTMLTATASANAAAQPERTGRAVVVLERPDLPPGKPARSARARASLAEARREIRRVIAANGLRPRQTVPELGLFSVRPSPGETVAALARRLRSDPRVVRVEAEERLELRVVEPNDPGYDSPDPNAPNDAPKQWHLMRENFPVAWEISQGGGARVGVIDTGIDGKHPDLRSRLGAAVDQGRGGGGDTDQHGHGTHVSGLACADSGNGYGIASAGFKCKVVMEKTDLSTTSIGDSLVDATNRDASVINMSFGFHSSSSAISRGVDYAVAHDVVLVAAAANDPGTEQGTPANLLQPTGTAPDINAGRGLVVTAAEFNGTRADFAGRGTQISIAAYGHSSDDTAGIFSTFPGNITELDTGGSGLLPPEPPCGCRGQVGGDDRFAYVSGTSMATPQVAGAAALIRSLQPTLSAPQVIRMLKSHAQRSGGWRPDLGWGILDAGSTLKAATRIDTIDPTSQVRTRGKVRTKRNKRTRKFKVRISGGDPTRGALVPSGIKRFDVYVARRRSGPYQLVRSTNERKFLFRGRAKRRYFFYSRAVDNAGRVEPAPSRFDSKTLVKKRKRKKRKSRR